MLISGSDRSDSALSRPSRPIIRWFEPTLQAGTIFGLISVKRFLAANARDNQTPYGGTRMTRSDYRPRIRRNRTAAIVGGVCAGLAEYLETDRTLVRIGAVVAGILLTKLTLLCYGVAWLLLDD